MKFTIRPWGLITALGFLAGFCTVAGFFGRHAWILDLASHFRVQYAVLLLLLGIVFLFMKRWWTAGAAFVLVGVNAAVIVPLYTGNPDGGPEGGAGDAGADVAGGKAAYRAMLINVNTRFGDPDAVIAEIRKLRPNFIVIEEIDGQWVEALVELTDEYPHRKIRPRSDNFGIALLSRHPFEEARVFHAGEIGVPSVFARFVLDGRPLNVVGTHPLPPRSVAYAYYRNDQLAKLPEYLKRLDGPVLLLGDLNISPWSHYYDRLLAETGLKDSARGRGVQPTWPVYIPPLLIPIDHCLHSEGIRIRDRFTGGDVGSDHYPVVVDFLLQ